MNECYVSFEQAKILKELGFDGWKYDDCDFWYYHNYDDSDKTIFDRREIVDRYDVKEYWFAPTLSQAQKWLREKYNIFISIDIRFPNYWDDDYSLAKYEFIFIDRRNNEAIRVESGKDNKVFDTYEQALMKAIDKALEILKEK